MNHTNYNLNVQKDVVFFLQLYTLPIFYANPNVQLTQVSHTSSSSYSMYILLNVTWQIKVHYMADILNIQSSCSHL